MAAIHQLSGPHVGILAHNIKAYAELRLCVLPIHPGTKTPCETGWNKGTKRLPTSNATADRYIAKYPDANLAIATGKISGLTVLDLDASANEIAELLKTAIDRFGDTPLKVRTPSGGLHLYYQYTGERCRNLRSEGLPIDVKAEGGYILVPPSQSPQRVPYAWQEGGLCVLAERAETLPRVKYGALNAIGGFSASVSELPATGIVKEGCRNDTLYRELCLHVASMDSRQRRDVSAIHAAAFALNNARMAEPLSDAEVIRIANSVAQRAASGLLYGPGSKAAVVIPHDQLPALMENSEGCPLALYCCLLQAHGGRAEPFAISPKAMARNNVLPQWKVHHYRTARDLIIKSGFVEIVHVGGQKPGDAHLFKLSRRGRESYPNIILHPAPTVLSDTADSYAGRFKSRKSQS